MHLRRCFLWLAGVDRRILDRCVNLGETEQIRFMGLGSLVLVPAVLSLFSMTYAIATFVYKPAIYLTVGVAWACIVLAIDRYLVSTVHKSSTRGIRQVAISILARYIFAVFLGVAISHPLVLLWFDNTINQTIDQHRMNAISARLKQAENDKANLAGTQQLLNLQTQRAAQVELQNCLITLQNFEQSNSPKVQLSCGGTTGVPTCASECKNIGDHIAEVRATTDRLDDQIRPIETALTAQRMAIDNRANQDVTSISARFSYDYLARVNALSEIARSEPQVTYVELFMIVFIVFVDVLPITMKLATPPGEYEEIFDTLLLHRRTAENATREILLSGHFQREMAEAHACATNILDKAEALTGVTRSLAEHYRRHTVDLAEQLVGLNHSVGDDPVRRAMLNGHVVSIIERSKDAWDAVLRHASNYMRKL